MTFTHPPTTKFTLYYAPRTISVAVAIVFEHLRIPYNAILVDFGQQEQTKSDYLEINPKGRVPTLETNQGLLTETPAILEHVAPQLVPSDPFKAAKMRELISYLNGTMHPNHAHGLRGERWATEPASFVDMKTKVPETMARSAAYLERALPDLPFAIGALAVLSDAYLYVVLTWLRDDDLDICDYPFLERFQSELRALPAVQSVCDNGMF